MRAQEQMQPHGEREGSGVSAAAGRGHLVIDLRDPRHPQPAPGPHEMLAEELRALVAALAGGNAAAHHGDRMERVEARDPAGPPEVPRAHQIGLLEIPGPLRAGGGIRLPASLAPPRLLPGGAVSLEEPVDRPQRGQGADPAPLQLQPDRLSPDPRKARGPGAMRGELGAELEHPGHHPRRCAPRPVLWSPTPGPQSRPPLLPEPAQPLREPEAASPQPLQDPPKSHALPMQLQGPTPQRVLILIFRHLALPDHTVRERLSGRLPRLLLYPLSSLRCCGGSSVCDVLAVTQ